MHPKQAPSEERPPSVLRYVLQRDRARHARLFALVVASIALGMVPVHLLRVLIDHALPTRDEREARWIGAALLGAALVRVLVDYGKAIESELVRQHVIARLRTELFAHLLRQPPEFFASNSVGQLMNKVQTDTGRLGMSVGWIFVEPLVEGVTVLVYAAYLASVDARMLLVALALLPLVVVAARRINRRLSAVSSEFTTRMGDYSARLQESFGNVSETQLHNTYAFEEARTERSQWRLVDGWMDVTRGNAWLAALSDVSRGVGPALVYTWGAVLAIRGTMPVGAVVAFSGLLSGLYSSLDKLLKYPAQLQVAQDRYDEFKVYFSKPKFFVDPPDPVSLESTEGLALSLDGLVFEHAQGRRVVDGLSLDVKPGEHVALVGRSGCG